ncbi:MAG: hypothetical protein ACREUE_15045 [Panacagrimonas sp.]
MIGLFRDFMRELTLPALKSEFEAYVETAIREELSRIEDYYAGGAFWVAEDGRVVGHGRRRAARQGCGRIAAHGGGPAAPASSYRLVREEVAAAQSHKTVGAGLMRYHYEK